MAARRQSREERLRKQREYQSAYRKRMKGARAPDRDVIAQAFLYHAVARSLGQGRAEQRLMRVLDGVEEFLVKMGFDPQATRLAINNLLDRYEAGWTFQRKLHLLQAADDVDAGGGQGGGR